MSKENFTVGLTCLFCGCTLQGKADVTYQSGDLIKCEQCGEGNDYDSVIEIAREKALQQVTEDLRGKLSGLFKGR